MGKPVPSDQVVTSLPSGPNKISSYQEEERSEVTGDDNFANSREHEVMMNGEVGYEMSEVNRKLGGEGSSISNQDSLSLKVKHYIASWFKHLWF